jgi:hypothetical protein
VDGGLQHHRETILVHKVEFLCLPWNGSQFRVCWSRDCHVTVEAIPDIAVLWKSLRVNDRFLLFSSGRDYSHLDNTILNLMRIFSFWRHYSCPDKNTNCDGKVYRPSYLLKLTSGLLSNYSEILQLLASWQNVIISARTFSHRVVCSEINKCVYRLHNETVS